MKNTGRLNPILMGYALLWGLQFVGPIVSALAANAIYRIPLYQVADVILSLDYCLIVIAEILLLVLLLVQISLRQLMDAARLVALIVSYGLLAFAPAFALQIYAWITHVDLLHDSRLYAMLLNLVGSLATAAVQAATGVMADAGEQALILRIVSVVGTLASLGLFVLRLPKVSMNQSPQVRV